MDEIGFVKPKQKNNTDDRPPVKDEKDLLSSGVELLEVLNATSIIIVSVGDRLLPLHKPKLGGLIH